MTDQLQLALITPAESVRSDIQSLFQKWTGAAPVECSSLEGVIDQMHQNDALFDVILIPSEIALEASVTTLCETISSDPLLSTIPVIGISKSSDRKFIEKWYASGADVVLLPPIDPGHLRYQIEALGRRRRIFEREFRSALGRAQQSFPAFQAFETLRDGIFIFDTKGTPTWINKNGKAMIGLSDEDPIPESVQKQFSTILEQHKVGENLSIESSKLGIIHSVFESSISRTDFRRFDAQVTAISLVDSTDQIAGYTICLSDLSELIELSGKLVQTRRTRSLALLSTAAVIRFLSGTRGQSLSAPIQDIEEFLRQAPSTASVHSVLTAVLEILDLVINPEIPVRVQETGDDIRISMKESDLFQLFGHLILYAVEYAGRGGEVTIDLGDNVPGEGVAVTLTSRSLRAPSVHHQDRIARLLRGEVFTETENAGEAKKLVYGIGAAQKIAEKYRTAVEYQKSDEELIKLRIKLPPSLQFT